MKEKNMHALLILLIISVFTDSSFSQSSRMKDKFYIGYFSLPYESQFTSTGFLNDYKALSLNAIQGYGTKGADTDPSHLQGGFNDSLNTYSANVKSMIGKFNSTLNDRSMLLSREKITRPAYGQRSTYQTEYGRSELVGNIKKPGYGYKHGGGSYYARETWQGETGISGRYCQTGTHSAQFIVDSLYENLEQVNDVSDNHLTSDRKSMYTDYRWYVKPRMRIPESFANNQSNWEKNVVRIDIYNFDGELLDSVNIKVRYFLDDNLEYGGNYLEIYKFDNPPYPLSILAVDLTVGAMTDEQGRTENLFDSKVDYRVYWYGEVNVWLDYVRVEDEWAHFLFNPQLETVGLPRKYFFNHKITEEVNAFSEGDSSLAYFYIDEYAYNNMPCIAEVNRIIKQTNSNTGLISVTCEECTKRGLRNQPSDDELYNSLYDKEINTDFMMVDKYPFTDAFPIPSNLNVPNPNLYAGTIHYTKASNPSSYNSYLNSHLISNNIIEQYRNVSEFVKEKDIVFSFASQIHNYEKPMLCDSTAHSMREPTNEEISLQCYLALAYGAKNIFHFTYNTERYINTSCSNDSLFLYGMLQTFNQSPRLYNYYNQNKWTGMKNLDSSLIKIGKYLYDQNSLVHDDNRTVDQEGLPFKYIKDIKSIYRDPSSPYNFTPTNLDLTKYWEFGFFISNASIEPLDKSKYFLAVNKRCTPEDAGANGDLRTLRIKFDSAQLSGFNNWKIIEAKTNAVIRTFDKDSNIYLFMGEFQPGEGKLFKLAPVMQEGGTLVTDENCSGEFECRGEVSNNGKSITINPGTTINFENTSARIVMNGGVFSTGVNTTEETAPVLLRGKNGNFWKGLSLNECGGVEMFTTYFENISPYPVDSTYAATMIDCEYINIARCIFHADLDIKTGGILIYYTSELRTKEVFVNYNQFIMDAGDMPALSIMTAGYITFPLIIEHNEFESYSGNSSNAMFLSGVVGGAIKENQITGYKNGITLIWSSMDIYGYNFDGGDADSKGVLSYASSNANLAPDGSTYTGGLNSISVEGENAKCIDVDNSFLLLDGGYNTFDIKNYEPGEAFHLSGEITDEAYADPLDATLNCFKVSGTDTVAVHNMTWTSTDPVNYNFIEYYCGDNESEGMIAFNLGNGNFDSLLTESSGSSGGFSNNHSEENVEIVSAEILEDSVSIDIRKRDYERVSELCHDLLDDYIDSIESSVIVQKLYLAELRLDSSGNRISDLKSYLEMLVLNNPENELLVKQAFYLIQKCKVALGQYESAMDGFEQIINQNPYSYEGLVASWDYAATSLLDSLHGTGGGIRNLEFGSDIDDDPKDKYDAKSFTKENRRVIRENVFNSYKTSRDKEAEIIKTLETKIAEANATKSEKNELRIKRILSEIVKAKEPVNIAEHIKNVNENIQVLFGSASGSTNEKEIKSIIPTEYNLSQNYPNPFNPVTKINFDLSQEGRVKLIVYDLLGREIIKLVNNELRSAGRHLVEFNGNNLSSGVYFYRLEVNDFVLTLRMILIK